MLLKHGLSFSKIRRQGYDGASNMKGEINGLKTLILSKTPSAYYIHCFAHQLQLTLVAVARNHGEISLFFNVVSVLTNLVGASCKRRDIVRETQAEKVADAISCGEIETGRGLNQEISLKRPSDTRWAGAGLRGSRAEPRLTPFSAPSVKFEYKFVLFSNPAQCKI
ncbi:Zinc finger MYM-type protein 1 [Linum perenne]